MPRITPERREAKRAHIMAAARRCFSRDGFHQTSMPDIAAEAGVSAGAPYRYFASKEEIILAIAADAFRLIFDPVEQLAAAADAPSVADLVAAALAALSVETVADSAGRPVPVDELLRCAVQTWSEVLRDDAVRSRALEGFESVRRSIADALCRGQTAGVVPLAMEPERGARMVMGLLHGLLLQRAAFDLTEMTGFDEDIRILLEGTERPGASSR
ncbi:TetR/AcrR family transcriptional regulator [Catenulispora sp. NF23]|uniref:TetR/AcrR family transcriptional regulator n=1 Tax=Catenulispora pinistramenti TaxID=2705254 RepID=A0ABS5KKW7_9ACTN|nr:TetR/AcrR family transcriptional regulator [Catenulispora pinistramenti]MBS2531228.1 TetR/AcrR family transcriptional regulator [Catenulispora pinistramenti]MBS2546688.1 TetR/AcrR family transcriptional regulator [Catenulispora pinistramenti]